jgi:membrane-bound lytic murein transglycosylase B
LLGIVDLLDEPRGTAEYRTGTPNFFAITHYNRSYFYAASVADLAQELANRLGYGAP